jgi:hypothetical protein
MLSAISGQSTGDQEVEVGGTDAAAAGSAELLRFTRTAKRGRKRWSERARRILGARPRSAKVLQGIDTVARHTKHLPE